MEMPKENLNVEFTVKGKGLYFGVFRFYDGHYCFFISESEYYLPEQVESWK